MGHGLLSFEVGRKRQLKQELKPSVKLERCHEKLQAASKLTTRQPGQEIDH